MTMRRGAQFAILVGTFFILIMCSGGGGTSSGCGSGSPTSPTPATAFINGSVTNSLTNQPVAGATVLVSATSTATISLTTTASGTFALSGIGSGPARIEAKAAGYRDFSTQVTLNSGGNTVNIQLIPSP